MNDHLTDQQLNAYLHQTLNDAQRETLDAHLISCPACRAHLNDLSIFQQRVRRDLTAELKAVNVPLSLAFETRVPQLKPNRRSIMSIARSRSVILYAIAAASILAILALNLFTQTTRPPALTVQSAAGPTITQPTTNTNLSTIIFGNIATLVNPRLTRNTFFPGEEIPLALLWYIPSPAEVEYYSFVHVLNEQGQAVVQADFPLRGADLNSVLSPPPNYMADLSLFLPFDLPPGQYQIAVGLYDTQSGQRLTTTQGETTATIGTIEVVSPLAHFGNVATLTDVELLTAGPTADDSFGLSLHWMISSTSPALTSFVHALDAQGDQLIAQSDQPLVGSGTTIQTTTLQLPASLAPGTYAIVAGVYDSTTFDRLPTDTGATTITVGAIQTSRSTMRFGSAVTLTEASLLTIKPAPNAALGLSLHWIISATNSTPLNTFVQVLDAQGNLVTQADQPLPETVSSAQSIILQLPETLTDGTYQLVIGVYDPATGSRLTTDSDETQISVTTFQVK